MGIRPKKDAMYWRVQCSMQVRRIKALEDFCLRVMNRMNVERMQYRDKREIIAEAKKLLGIKGE